MIFAAVQTAVYSAVSNDAAISALVTGVYADVPQPTEPDDDSIFPYVTIGQDIASPWDSKTYFGTETTVQIDVWSRSNNYIEAKQISELILAALHHQPLIITGADHTMTVHQNTTVSIDPDGHTKRAMMMFSITATDS